MTIALHDLGEYEIAAPFCRLILSERHDIWCIVSVVDWPWIIKHRWNYGWHVGTPWKRYAKRNVGRARSTVYLHREILIAADPRTEVFQWTHHADHVNGQSLDNRRENLRWLTPGENRAHRIPRAQIPSLQSIIRSLTAAAQPVEALVEEVPF